ncbi:MAG: hypothetical protein ACK4ZM_03205, partial [bacterium]
YVRLSGPYITELPKGTKLQIIGKQQHNYKVKLSFSLSGWVEEKNISFNTALITYILKILIRTGPIIKSKETYFKLQIFVTFFHKLT